MGAQLELEAKYKASAETVVDMRMVISKNYQNILKVAKVARIKAEEVARANQADNLQGLCVKTSEFIANHLTRMGYKAKVVSGYCWYDMNFQSCTDMPGDPHTWVQVYGLPEFRGRVCYIDVTGDQFNYWLEHKLSEIEVGAVPACMHKGRPSKEYIDAIGW